MSSPMSIQAPEACLALRRHENELRQRLSALEGDGSTLEEGSDAWHLIEALCGVPQEGYLAQFAASGRLLAEQGGHLEVRLASIERWHAALEMALADLFRDEPYVLAQAAGFLGRLVTRIVLTLTQEFQAAQLRRAEEETERARRGITRLQALQRINNATNSTLDLDQTLVTAAQAVVEEMDADLCAIFLFDDVTRELVLRATNGPSPRGGQHFTLALGEGYTGWVAEHGHPLIVQDAASDPRFTREASAYPVPYAGLLSVPIIFFTGVKLEGVISVQTREPQTFSEAELNFLEIVAGQLAMNIENGRLYEQTDEKLRRKVYELSTLHRVSALVTSTLVLDKVLQIIVAQAVQLSGADRSVLFELHAASQRLHAVANHGFEGHDLSRASVQVGKCCVGRVAQTGEPSMLMDCLRTDHSCFLHSLPEAVGDQHAVLCAPLNTVHGALGALCVFSSRRHTLDEYQQQLVVTFANVAAIAMENAKLFSQTRQGLRARETLLREMHHRVKNNLQTVASFLRMQMGRETAPEVQQMLQENIDRIQGIAETHDLLSKANQQLGIAPMDEIARKIAGIVRGNLVPPQLHLRFHVGAAPFPMPTDQATTLSIVLNELIANAIEHGYAGRERGEIRITGAQEDDTIVVRVADDGRGLPEGFSLQSVKSLGLGLVRNLVQDLRGSVTFFETVGNPDLPNASKGPGLRITNPGLQTVPSEEGERVRGGDAAGGSEAPSRRRHWTVAELRFPVPVEDPGLRAAALAADLT